MNHMNLTDMKAGAKAVIVHIEGGLGLVGRLNALGIRTGVHITKISSQLMRGPVTLALGNTQLAIGHGMARKIMVDLES